VQKYSEAVWVNCAVVRYYYYKRVMYIAVSYSYYYSSSSLYIYHKLYFIWRRYDGWRSGRFGFVFRECLRSEKCCATVSFSSQNGDLFNSSPSPVYGSEYQ
jgi:hypothetical protein